MRRALFFLTFFSLSLALALGETPRTRAILETSLGKIEVELFTDKAPLSAGHFIRMVREGYLNKGSFYRTVTMENQPRNKVKILVVQGGLMEDRLVDKAPRVAHETTEQTGLSHLRGALSFARSEPGSASTEFFITLRDEPELDFGGKRNPDGQGFAVFGRVVSGMDVVEKIHRLKEKGQRILEPLPFTLSMKGEG